MSAHPRAPTAGDSGQWWSLFPRIRFIHIGTIQTYEQEVSDFYLIFRGMTLITGCGTFKTKVAQRIAIAHNYG